MSNQKKILEELFSSKEAIEQQAAEIERLRNHIAIERAENKRLREELTNSTVAVAKIAQQRDHYRAVIDSAPHGKGCAIRLFRNNKFGECNCWKAKVDDMNGEGDERTTVTRNSTLT